jgi:hypothetical protein
MIAFPLLLLGQVLNSKYATTPCQHGKNMMYNLGSNPANFPLDLRVTIHHILFL